MASGVKNANIADNELGDVGLLELLQLSLGELD
jgi:hypothetical protein